MKKCSFHYCGWVNQVNKNAELKGATIIAMAAHHNKLLAVIQNSSSLTPYVCWRLANSGEFTLGQYYSNQQTALEAYDKR